MKDSFVCLMCHQVSYGDAISSLSMSVKRCDKNDEEGMFAVE